nr:retrovirus-related Pol polyprotein from transposon TNT 1-94 [Tanacetum cinerariifolium]
MRLIQSLASKELVRNLPNLKFDQHFCDAFKIRKQAHASHKAKNIVLMTRFLELVYMDIYGLSVVRSYGGNLYTLVIVDDYSRMDHGREFDNEMQFEEFCNTNGYSQNSKAYIILNKHTMKIKESLNVTFAETPPPSKTSPLVDDDLDKEEEIKVTEKKNLKNDIEDETLEIDKIVNVKESRKHPLENIIGNLNQRTLRNKLDKNDAVSRNNVRLVAQGYNQQEGIDYDETYAPVTRLESIRILLAYDCALDFKLFQMDVKSAFLNGFINEEVYVAQPSGFIDFEKPNHVYKLKKLYMVLNKHPKLGFDKTPYELINKRKPNIKFFRVFRCRCYLLNDYEDVGKLKANGDIRVFVGYSKESVAFRIYNKRTRKIHESVNVNFDEISEMASKQFSLEPDLSKLNETGKSLNPSVSNVDEASKKDLEDLFQDFYDEYFDSSKIMKSSTTNVKFLQKLVDDKLRYIPLVYKLLQV